MEKIRIGFIGCGGIARHHARCFKPISEVEISALTDTSEESLALFQKDGMEGKPVKNIYADYRKMLEKEPLDGVLIASPHTLHFEQVKDCLEAGKHVLVEKPMVTATADAIELLKIRDQTNRTLSVAFPGPFTKEFAFIQREIKKGSLGTIRLVEGWMYQEWIKHAKGKWRGNPALSGGGQCYDSGAHMFNAMLYLTGLSAKQVFAQINNLDMDVDIMASVSIRFDSDALGTASVSGDCKKFEQGVFINGTEGSVKTAVYGGSIEYHQGDQLVASPGLAERTGIHQNFVNCIKGTEETPSPAELGLKQARLMDAIYKSAKTGNPVNVVSD